LNKSRRESIFENDIAQVTSNENSIIIILWQLVPKAVYQDSGMVVNKKKQQQKLSEKTAVIF